ncbi:MAG TPA: adenylate/guanylate cyclase domain-containing protein [Acidimicrobiales bacterium]|jgi:adenylate cyclase|nr:adenylate/guanylate cyclase domain-containing protein [Acidimicrobiales bacterium]
MAGDRQTFWQRRALKSLVKHARTRGGEPLGPHDWQAYFEWAAQPRNRVVKRMMRALPSTPRCGFCGAPFHGFGGRLVRPLGYRPSRKNPAICAVCVELAPPGGLTTDIGVLFADLRGFTTRAESLSPAEASALLRRFYACAEAVLFPEALIDKLIGDEVMALYIPFAVRRTAHLTADDDAARVASVMVEHARRLLERIGYGTADGPAFDVGIGIDYGEAFVGNIGDTAVHDFTAVGDVVNTASRLQGCAASGEVVVSARCARHLASPPSDVVENIAVKGKQEPVAAHRLRWFAD